MTRRLLAYCWPPADRRDMAEASAIMTAIIIVAHLVGAH